jgi:RNA polymerase sigma factor (sigma-70 family)
MNSRAILDDLIQAIRAGDRAAFDAALSPERAWLLSRAQAVAEASLRPFVDPEDLLQDTLLTAYRKLAATRVRTAESLRRWLSEVMHNRATDLRRRYFLTLKHGCRPTSLAVGFARSESGSSLQLGECLPESGASPSTGAAASEAQARVRSLLERLSPDHRQVVELVKLQNLEVREVAERMKRSPEAIYKLLARALESCRAILPTLNGARQPEAG